MPVPPTLFERGWAANGLHDPAFQLFSGLAVQGIWERQTTQIFFASAIRVLVAPPLTEWSSAAVRFRIVFFLGLRLPSFFEGFFFFAMDLPPCVPSFELSSTGTK